MQRMKTILIALTIGSACLGSVASSAHAQVSPGQYGQGPGGAVIPRAETASGEVLAGAGGASAAAPQESVAVTALPNTGGGPSASDASTFAPIWAGTIGAALLLFGLALVQVRHRGRGAGALSLVRILGKCLSTTGARIRGAW